MNFDQELVHENKEVIYSTHFGVNVVNRNITQVFQSEIYTQTHKLLFHRYIMYKCIKEAMLCALTSK